MIDEQRKNETAFNKAAHKYLMDNQDDGMIRDVSEIMGDWALDAFEAGWKAALTGSGLEDAWDERETILKAQHAAEIAEAREIIDGLLEFCKARDCYPMKRR